MSLHKNLIEKAQEDVRISLETWTIILERSLSNKLDYVYAKGSATKKWETAIDYVPYLSDVDIHLKLKKTESIFNFEETAFHEALKLSEDYEKEFIKSHPNYMHIPRTQIITLNEIEQLPNYVPPQPDSVYTLIGDPEIDEFQYSEENKKNDLLEILNLKDLLKKLPMSAMDRVGLDFWTLIRRMNWRISPTPVRILTQILQHPDKIWGWNRTKVCSSLESNDFQDISELYKSYYNHGWELFLANFEDLSLLRSQVDKGYQVLKKCFQTAQNRFTLT